jgi:hypothetical protein
VDFGGTDVDNTSGVYGTDLDGDGNYEYSMSEADNGDMVYDFDTNADGHVDIILETDPQGSTVEGMSVYDPANGQWFEDNAYNGQSASQEISDIIAHTTGSATANAGDGNAKG